MWFFVCLFVCFVFEFQLNPCICCGFPSEENQVPTVDLWPLPLCVLVWAGASGCQPLQSHAPFHVFDFLPSKQRAQRSGQGQGGPARGHVAHGGAWAGSPPPRAPSEFFTERKSIQCQREGMGFLLHREWALKRHWLPRAGQSLNPPPPLRGPVVASDQPLPPPLPLWGGGSCLVTPVLPTF